MLMNILNWRWQALTGIHAETSECVSLELIRIITLCRDVYASHLKEMKNCTNSNRLIQLLTGDKLRCRKSLAARASVQHFRYDFFYGIRHFPGSFWSSHWDSRPQFSILFSTSKISNLQMYQLPIYKSLALFSLRFVQLIYFLYSIKIDQ